MPALVSRLLMLCLLLALAQPALAERRVALVIGNASYANASPLANPLNDARAVADKLAALGFEVSRHENLGGQQMRMALGQFTETALNAEIALVFYAGHGIELSGENYLIPVDAQMRSEATAQFEALALNDVLTSVQLAGRLGIVMLDACRDNPFGANMVRNNGTRAVSRGLAPVSVEGAQGLVVSFAAQEGSTADDGAGQHSPYTTALLTVLDEPGLEIGRVFRKVRAQVREATGGRQVPVERMQLPDEAIYFVPPNGGPAPVTPVAQPPAAGPDPMALFLEAVQSNDPARLSGFLAAFPDHAQAPAARALLTSLQDDAYWAQVAAEDSLAAYRRYLIAFAQGNHVAAAEARIAALTAVAAPAPSPAPSPSPSPKPQTLPALGSMVKGPSFDCAKARTLVETTICASLRLMHQDGLLGEAYKASRVLSSAKGPAQRQWVAEREAICTGSGWTVADCILQLTDDRTAALNAARLSGNVAPGFNCARAGTPVEKAICASDALARQDLQLWTVYTAAQDRGRVSDAAQRDWVKLREARCQGADNVALCVAQETALRMAILAR